MVGEVGRFLFAFLLALQAGDPGTPAAPKHSIVFTQMPYQLQVHTGKVEQSFLLNRAAGKGSRIVRLSPNGAFAELTTEFVAAADPSVSFDGRRLLFAGKQASGDPWNIWEMDTDGKNKRQITKDLGDCREPEYLALSSITPPDFENKVRWILFVSTASNSYSESGSELATSLYVTNLEPIQERGSVTWRTTFNLSSDFSPTVLRDGRVLFASSQRPDSNDHAPAEFHLLASNWDGTGLNLFCGSEQGMLFKTMATETPDRTLVFVEYSQPYGLGGRLARVFFRRPLHSYEALSRGEGWYLNPHALPDGRLVVSYTAGKESYGIFFFDFDKGMPGMKVFDDPNYEDLDALPLVARAEPQGLISSVVDSLTWGELHCINVYESDRPAMAQVRKGEIVRARFIQGIPARPPLNKDTTNATSAKSETRIMGEAPVESDGSFFVRVPADTSFTIELLNDRGTTVQKMSRWIWVRAGTSRGCIGCHESKELAPENRVTDALKKAKPHDLQNK